MVKQYLSFCGVWRWLNFWHSFLNFGFFLLRFSLLCPSAFLTYLKTHHLSSLLNPFSAHFSHERREVLCEWVSGSRNQYSQRFSQTAHTTPLSRAGLSLLVHVIGKKGHCRVQKALTLTLSEMLLEKGHRERCLRRTREGKGREMRGSAGALGGRWRKSEGQGGGLRGTL